MRARHFLGVLFILIGILFWIAPQFGMFIGIENVWPLLIVGIGLAFELAYFSSPKIHGFLIPGGILLTLGLLFFFETITHWQFSEYTWPVYPLAVAFGLLQLYLFSNRPFALLIPIFILGGFSALAWAVMIFGALAIWIHWGTLIPLLLIGIGLALIFRK